MYLSVFRVKQRTEVLHFLCRVQEFSKTEFFQQNSRSEQGPNLNPELKFFSVETRITKLKKESRVMN